MARGEVEIVPRAIKIGGHCRDEVATVLPSIGLTQLEPRYLGNGIPFIGGLKRPSEQRTFFDRLWRQSSGRSGGAEEE